MKNQRTERHSYVEDGVTVGFLTDPTLCIGCKACEVACKEWNDVPSSPSESRGEAAGLRPGRRGHSYDHSGSLGADQWRHVKFVETETPAGLPRWLFLSDVCKHCERAGCLEACPTGAIRRTETGTVLVEDDLCNGCGYCVVSCPFGVIDRRGREHGETPSGARPAPAARSRTADSGSSVDPDPLETSAGGAFKCTFCTDRQAEGRIPACASACPTDSILFAPLDDLRAHAAKRLQVLASRGVNDASIYDPAGVGGVHALSVLVGAGEVAGDDLEDANARLWGLPTDPLPPSTALPGAWLAAVLTGLAAALACWLAFGGAA